MGGADIRSRKVVFRFDPVTDTETPSPWVEYRLVNHTGHRITVDSRKMFVTIGGHKRRCYWDDSLPTSDVDPGHEIDVSWCTLTGLPKAAVIAYGGVVVAEIHSESGQARVEPRPA